LLLSVQICIFITKKLTKRFASMKNIALYGSMLHSDRVSKFELLYLNNRLADLGYYRLSYKLFGWNTKLKVYRIGDVILMKFFAFLSDKQEDWGVEEDSSFCFILSRLQLVRSMRHVIV